MSTDPKDITVNWNNTVKSPAPIPVPPTDTSNMVTYLTEGADLTAMQNASSGINSLIGRENFTKNDNE